MYANGKKTFEHAADKNPVVDFKNSGRSVYDIGLRKDTGETIHAYLSDLMIFNRVLSEHELKHDLYENHALTPWNSLLRLSVIAEYTTRELNRSFALKFTIKTLLLSGVTELVSTGNISCYWRHQSRAREWRITVKNMERLLVNS